MKSCFIATQEIYIHKQSMVVLCIQHLKQIFSLIHTQAFIRITLLEVKLKVFENNRQTDTLLFKAHPKTKTTTGKS